MHPRPIYLKRYGQSALCARRIADGSWAASKAGAGLRIGFQHRADAEAGLLLRHAESKQRLRMHAQTH